MRILTTLLLMTIALSAGGNGFAAQRQPDVATISRPPASNSVMQSDGLSLSEAVEQVRRQCNGRIVSAETERSGNRETHVIKCLTQDGKVRTFRVPGKRSG